MQIPFGCLTALRLLDARLGAGIVLVTRAVPTTESASTLAIEATLTLDDLLDELSTATYISDRGTRTITFVVPDRDEDGRPEVISYAWDGAPGHALTRQRNGGAVIVTYFVGASPEAGGGVRGRKWSWSSTSATSKTGVRRM